MAAFAQGGAAIHVIYGKKRARNRGNMEQYYVVFTAVSSIQNVGSVSQIAPQKIAIMDYMWLREDALMSTQKAIHGTSQTGVPD